MSIDRAVMVFAGSMILLSLALSQLHSYWLLLTAVVGIQLIQSAFTGFCPAAMLFKRLGLRPGTVFQ
jgi:Inner membrane protein YgaP-like, transmembrane domain